MPRSREVRLGLERFQPLAAEREGPGAEAAFRAATGVELAVVLADLYSEL